ncbi:MAG: hypothetical protein QF574_06805 [Arenicellales bacterium]|nr:hypothetical protein [Arenicellales bacterium]
MNTVYYETIDKLEKMGVNPDYVQGMGRGIPGKPTAARAKGHGCILSRLRGWSEQDHR